MSLHPHPYRLGLLFSLLIALMLALLALLLAGRAASAQPPVLPSHSAPYWDATYWANTSLSGSPVLQREESTLDHDWGNASPDGRVPVDHFSARWLRYVDFDAGVYRFTATSDDGIRLYIDDQLAIDQWHIHAKTSYMADVSLAEGHHLLRVEYFENEGVALAQLQWQPRYETSSGEWRGEFFDNTSLAGEPDCVRYTDSIDYTWTDSPCPGDIDDDNFSVRWTRNAGFNAGNYRFYILVDDGARLYVNNHLLIDKWFDQSSTAYSGEIYLPGGNVPLTFEMYEHLGGARARLTWERIEPDDYDHDDGEAYDEDSWRGEYFNNENLSGTPDRVRYDDEIDFNWGNRSPASSIDRDHFSVRWTRSVYFRGGRYRFTTETDDGVRLYIDGTLVIDEWRAMSRSEFSVSRNLDRGTHKIRMEYFEWVGDATAELSWDRTGDEEEEEQGAPVGNIITCVPPQPDHCAWIKVYRLDPSGNWIDLSEKGFASWAAGGFLKIDGLLVDVQTFGEAGHPYRVEQWVDGQRVRSTGNFQAGEPAFLVRPYTDNYTPWQCPQ